MKIFKIIRSYIRKVFFLIFCKNRKFFYGKFYGSLNFFYLIFFNLFFPSRSLIRFKYNRFLFPKSFKNIDGNIFVDGKGSSKEDVLKTAAKLQKKIHPDMNRDVNSERLSQLVNEAKEKILKTDFS